MRFIVLFSRAHGQYKAYCSVIIASHRIAMDSGFGLSGGTGFSSALNSAFSVGALVSSRCRAKTVGPPVADLELGSPPCGYFEGTV
jgi:hypothetical protein